MKYFILRYQLATKTITLKEYIEAKNSGITPDKGTEKQNLYARDILEKCISEEMTGFDQVIQEMIERGEVEVPERHFDYVSMLNDKISTFKRLKDSRFIIDKMRDTLFNSSLERFFPKFYNRHRNYFEK